MKGDFSRLTFDPKKHYRGVLMQQGRVQLDADWNEQVDIVNHRIETEAHDLIGSGGAPIENPGFEISASSWLKFDGDDDYIYVEGHRDLSFAGKHPFSLEARVLPHESGSVSTIISKFNDLGRSGLLHGEYFLDVEPDGSLSFHRAEIIEDANVEEITIEGGEVADVADIRAYQLALSSLHTGQKLSFKHASHVAVTFDGEESRIYINGQIAARQKHERRGVHTRVALLVGARMFDYEPANFYRGWMNEIRVWNVAQTQDQIQYGMNRTLGGHEHGLVAYWRADEIADGKLRDLTGRHHDGVCGAGSKSQGPQADSGEVRISAGRYYVDGILCENETDLSYERQPDYPGATLPKSGAYLAYLDVWQRFITAIEDPAVRDPALGGPDTTGRSRVVSQVKLLPTGDDQDKSPHQHWQDFIGSLTGKAKLRARHQATGFLPSNQLYRVEIHSGGRVYGGSPSKGTAIRVQSFEPDGTNTIRVQVADWVVEGISLAAAQWVEVFSEGCDGSASFEYLLPVKASDPAGGTITLVLKEVPPELLDRRSLRLRPIATLKWSRENGSVVFRVKSVEQQSVALDDFGRDASLISEGDWVETVNDVYVLQSRPAPLFKVNSVQRTPLTVTLNELPPGDVVDPATYPLMRRWDQQTINGDPLVDGLVPACSSYGQTRWLNLENGIQISFDSGGLQTGDYWLIPSRANSGAIEWPGDAAKPAAVPPHGIKHHYSLLALLRFNEGAVTAQDYRRIFSPLTSIESSDGKNPFVKKSGDTINGSLKIERSLQVEGETHLRILHGEMAHTGALHAVEAHVARLHAGETYVEELHGELAAGMVGERQIVDGSVTRAKLADGVRDLWAFPSGYSILGPTPIPPPDFAYTGSYIVVSHDQVGWTTRAETRIEGIKSLASVVVRDRIYTFTERGAVWEFDPETCGWRERAMMPDGGQLGGATAVGDKVYAFFNSGEVWEYDPGLERQERAWTRMTDMPGPRHGFGLAVVNGKIFAFGGKRKVLLGLLSVTTKRNDVYDPASNTWAKRRSMKAGRYAFGVGVVNEKICLVGGMEGLFLGIFKRTARLNEKYHPASDRWSRGLPATPLRRNHAAVAALDDKVYAIGGKNRDQWTATSEVLSPLTGWSEMKTLPHVVSLPNVLVIKGKLYLLGGDPSRPHTCIVEELPVRSIYYAHQKSFRTRTDQSKTDQVEPAVRKATE